MIRAIALSVFALSALVALQPAQADVLYKCVSPGKPASYQNEPCTGGSRLASIREYEPGPDVRSPPSPPKAHETPRGSRQSQRTRGVPAHSARSQGKSDSCQSTKDARDAWERRIGLGRTYEALQAWNDRIRMACK